MYKIKYVLGQTIIYKGNKHRIVGVHYTAGGRAYKLSGIRNWIREEEIMA